MKSRLDWYNLKIPKSSLKVYVNVDPFKNATEQLKRKIELLETAIKNWELFIEQFIMVRLELPLETIIRYEKKRLPTASKYSKGL